MQKNDIIRITINDMSVNGEGIGRYEGMSFFVPNTVVGDVITAGITKLKKTYGYARLISLDEPSGFRTDPPCPVCRYCGGCSIMNLDYKKQLDIKENTVKNALRRIGGFSDNEIELAARPIIGMDDPYHYRNKAQYPIGRDKNDKPVIGFFAPHSHRIIEPGPQGCMIGAETDINIINTLKSFIDDYDISIYDEKTHKGLLRHLLLRRGFATEEVMVCMIINGNSIPHTDELILRIRKACPNTRSIVLNENRKPGNVILGDKTHLIWGQDHITDELLGHTFKISAESFYQVNPLQTQRLYNKAVEYASLKKTDVVWDLYCGIGTIGITMADKVREVIGIEIVDKAVKDAKENVHINNLDNVKFFTGSADRIFSPEYSIPPADVIVVDPPRKGLDEKTISLILEAAPDRLVYVSCNPSTLARDLALLTLDKYTLKEYTPIDQFPHGMHVESIALLERVSNRKADAKVHIDVDLEDYYRIKDAQGKDGK